MNLDPAFAFFDLPHALLGEAARRPLSLASADALRLMGITVHLPGHGLAAEEEMAQMAAYDYLHRAKIEQACEMVSLLGWRALSENAEFPEHEIAQFRVAMERQAALLQACDYKIRLTPDEQKIVDKQPGDLIHPSLLALRLRRIAKDTGWSREFILWHLPLAEALQLLHASQLADGRTTVAPAQEAMSTPEDLTPEWMGAVSESGPLTPEPQT